MDFSGLDFKFQEIADPKSLNFLDKIGQALVKIYTNMPKTVVLPKVFQVNGSVKVTDPVKIANLEEVAREIRVLQERITVFAQAASTAQLPKIEFPKFEIPQQIATPVDISPITEAIHELQAAIAKAPVDTNNVTLLRSIKEGIESLVNRPVMTPQPVTNVTLNALQGYIKTTSSTVGTTAGRLPGYGQLFNRRAVQIYNNSANTIYVGGSDVAVANGIPVTSGSFSTIFDAGYNMIVYGIAASSGNDVRVLEISKDQTANVQE